MNTHSKKAFANHLLDLLSELGSVKARAMFGGHGLFLDGLMFALLSNEQLYLKVDAQSVEVFSKRNLTAFEYEARGKTMALSYCQAPPEAMESSDYALPWARLGVEAAIRSNANKARKPSSRKKTDRVDAKPLSTALNLGPKSQAMLAKAGIHTLADVQALGAVRAYVQTKAVWPKASVNLLWALEGALTGRHWQTVAQEDGVSLLMALEDAQRHQTD